jgi:hypothetical protein
MKEYYYAPQGTKVLCDGFTVVFTEQLIEIIDGMPTRVYPLKAPPDEPCDKWLNVGYDEHPIITKDRIQNNILDSLYKFRKIDEKDLFLYIL